jgi:hypothetical protein
VEEHFNVIKLTISALHGVIAGDVIANDDGRVDYVELVEDDALRDYTTARECVRRLNLVIAEMHEIDKLFHVSYECL